MPELWASSPINASATAIAPAGLGDPLFTKKFRQTLHAAGVRCLKMPKQSPNLNAYAESFVRTIKRECLHKMILFGEPPWRYSDPGRKTMRVHTKQIGTE